jgi:hypothetical protein
MTTRSSCSPCNGNCHQGRTCPARRQQTLDRLAAQLGRLWLFVCAVIVAGLVLLASHPANAATVGLHLATAHFGGDGTPLKSATPGAYLVTDLGLSVGTYRNSYGRSSTYAGWTLQTDDQRFAITVGAVTGYSAARVMPLLVPSARIPITSGVSARLSFIPKPVKSGHAAGLHLSIERGF